MTTRSTLLLVSCAAAACATGTRLRDVAEPPLPHQGSAYEAAARLELPPAPPRELPGLHNVYRLSEDIVSGGEPADEAALAHLADMGIRTILSVDGKEPDHEAAARYGMRYVHVPIRYNGITEEEMLAIAKTFRELEGPFYVHCFHGKHRGPAAAAVGRVVRDGVTREQAIAEMRQWCGTAPSYEGLYAAIAFGEIPDARATAAHDFDFPPAHRFQGLRQAMVNLARAWEIVEAQSKREWSVDPAHPDANARNEARRMAETFAQIEAMEDTEDYGEDFHEWLRSSVRDSRALAAALGRVESGEPDAGQRAWELSRQLRASCKDCHGAYRN